MNELYAALLSWAVTLSGYPAPDQPPEVVSVSHQFFVDNACGGHECKVYGWYAGGRRLYVDTRLDPQEDLLASSVVVHEMVHYLQGASWGIPEGLKGAAYGEVPTCHEAIEMEIEAYAAQREFLLRYGEYQPVGVSMLRVGCSPDHQESKPASPE